MREFVSPPQNHVWEMNQKIQKIEQNLNTLTSNQDIPLKLRKVGDHEYKLYVDLNGDQLSQLKNNPNSSIMGIPIDLSSSANYPSFVNFSKYSYAEGQMLIQSISINYQDMSDDTSHFTNRSDRPDDTSHLSVDIIRYKPNFNSYMDISNSDLLIVPFNQSYQLETNFLKYLLQYFNINDEQATITNLKIEDLTIEGTYIIKTGSTFYPISNLDSVIKFPEGKAPTFEVNKTYILKVTYDAESRNYYCTDVKSFSNT